MAEGKGKVTIKPWKKALSPEAALAVMEKFLPEMIDAGQYTPMEDVILCPFNKAFGTIELNKIIATHLARKYNPDNEPVYEVIAGLNKKYFRVGDKVLFNKTEHTITRIEKNNKYFGKPFKDASPTLDYWGIEHDAHKTSAIAALLAGDELATDHAKSIDDILNSFSLPSDEKSGLVQAASHTIVVWSEELECEEVLESSGEVGQLDLGYAITVHKSQGSEYRRVFFITHSSHSNMLFRELIYTAITRAKEELYVICPPAMFVAGVTSQRLPGKTLDDKIAAFERYAQLNAGRTSEDEIPKGTYLFEAA
ncbi:ATP-dependent RecD-like DNA helicase [compost metagenome]